MVETVGRFKIWSEAKDDGKFHTMVSFADQKTITVEISTTLIAASIAQKKWTNYCLYKPLGAISAITGNFIPFSEDIIPYEEYLSFIKKKINS